MTQSVTPSVSQPINQRSNESIEILKNDDVDGGQSVFEIMDLLQSRTMSQWCFIQRTIQMKGMYDSKTPARKIK